MYKYKNKVLSILVMMVFVGDFSNAYSQLLPFITRQPKSVAATEGSSVIFLIEAVDAKSYQWRKDGEVLEDKNGSTLTLNQIRITDAGRYDCLVSNDVGTVISEKATLTITEGYPEPIIVMKDNVLVFPTTAPTDRRDTVLTEWVSNIGSVVLNIHNISIDPKSINRGDFILVENRYPVQVNPGESLELKVAFVPKSRGYKTATLELFSDGGRTQRIVLEGESAGSPGNVELDVLQSSISIFPNPVSSITNVKLHNKMNINGESDIRVYDVVGNLVLSERMQIDSDDFDYSIDATALNNGVYYIVVGGDFEFSTATMIVVK